MISTSTRLPTTPRTEQLATEDPSNFGLSIGFEHNWGRLRTLRSHQHARTEMKDDQGTIAATEVRFVSPDPLNTENLPHARIKKLWAADVVDDPAANPGGLFHRKTDLLSDGKALLDFATGRTNQPPVLSQFSIAPERVRDFFTRYLADSGLTISRKDDSMNRKAEKPAATDEEDPKPTETGGG